MSGALAIEGALTVTLDGASDAARTVGGISTGANNQGVVEVNRGGTGRTTFSGTIGTSTNRLGGLTLTAGSTAFAGDVFAGAITRTAGLADFDGDVTASSISLNGTGGTAFAGDVSGALAIEGASTVVFNGTAEQMIGGAITAAENGKGAVEVSNPAGVTLGGDVGTSEGRIGRLSLDSVAQLTLNGQVYVETLAVGEGAASTVVLGGSSSRNGTDLLPRNSRNLKVSFPH